MSIPTGTKKALVLGFCYPTTSDKLPGCQTDVQAVAQILQSTFGYQTQVVTDNSKTPLGDVISTFLTSTVPGSQYLLYYSGHGSENGDKTTFYNTNLQPWTEDQFRTLLQSVSAGVKLVIIIDACNSGTACDLPFCYATSTPNHPFTVDLASGEPFKADIISLGACQESQLAYNVYDNSRKGVYGAFTKSLLDKINGSTTWIDLVNVINTDLKNMGIPQNPQLCASKVSLLTSTL